MLPISGLVGSSVATPFPARLGGVATVFDPCACEQQSHHMAHVVDTLRSCACIIAADNAQGSNAKQLI